MSEVTRTATHAFYIQPGFQGQPGFEVRYRPLNPKSGSPWQADRRINDQADVEHRGYEGRPNAYSTMEAAQAAVARQAAKLTKGRGA